LDELTVNVGKGKKENRNLSTTEEEEKVSSAAGHRRRKSEQERHLQLGGRERRTRSRDEKKRRRSSQESLNSTVISDYRRNDRQQKARRGKGHKAVEKTQETHLKNRKMKGKPQPSRKNRLKKKLLISPKSSELTQHQGRNKMQSGIQQKVSVRRAK